MKKPIAFSRLRGARGGLHRSGSALLITLAFVILLTVLIVSFLSRAILEQHISSSSANQVKSELFAEGIQATLIGDLEQEIINGSTATTTGSGTTSTTIYVPTTPANMVPMYDYSGCPTGATGPAATLANLLKVSTSSPATTPIASTFPTATSALTTTASFNGRSVSLARWNESYMIDPTGTLPTPNWIMLARDGSNPTTFANSGASDVTLKLGGKTNTKTVIGRYAYVMYDEGGLIDMNVAGQPSTLSSAPAPYASAASYRNGETFADLTQIGMTQTQIDNLIGWRNTASAQISASSSTGTFTSVTAPTTTTPYTQFTWSTANATNYVSNVQNNSTGNLTVANPSVSNAGKIPNSTDQAFTSRYELIQFIQNLYNASSSAAKLTSANTALQYMTHFSRGLSQPSFIPPVNDPTLTTTQKASITTPTSTGTDTTFNTGQTNTAEGQDSSINPSFLTVRVGAAFTRNDGSAASVGEPLVKKRFNLNRLAWLTYEGPLCDGHYSGVATSAAQITNNADLQIMANQLHNTYGLSWAFLQQGTAGNIYNYFGLNWLKDDPTIRTKPLGDGQMKWFYNHSLANYGSGASTTGPFTSLTTLLSSAATISRLSSLANSSGSLPAREPDFAELLKAGIAAGSKAKVATLPTGNKTPAGASGSSTTQITISATMPDNIAFQSDASISIGIFQIMANVIDQYDLDGFPTRIVYEDPNILLPREYDGIENLPYFYRVRSGCLEQAALTGTVSSYNSSTGAVTNGSVTAPGAYTFLLMPEIWNPHDQNSPRCALDPTTGKYLADSTGKVLFPTSFRLVADSIDPDDIQTSLTTIENTYWLLSGSVEEPGAPNAGYASPSNTSTLSTDTYSNQAPWANGVTGLQQMASSLTTFPIFAENSALAFSIPTSTSGSGTAATTPASDAGNGFFREPTLLLTPNTPSGSNLIAAGSYNPLSNPNANAVPGTTTNSKEIDLQSGGYAGSGYLKGSDGNKYLGVYLGTNPGAWYSYPPVLAANPTSTPPVVGYNPVPNPPLPRWCNVATGWSTLNNNSSGANKKLLTSADSTFITYRMEYNNTYDASNPGWSTYDTKYTLSGARTFVTSIGAPKYYLMSSPEYSVAYDPRSSRFAVPHASDLFAPGYYAKNSSSYSSAYGWINSASDLVSLISARPDYSNGYWVSPYEGPANDPPDAEPQAYGWATSGVGLTANVAPLGLTAQNDPHFTPLNGKVAASGTPTTSSYGSGGTTAQFYADPDGVVRRGTAAYYSGTGTSGPGTTGLPLATANSVSGGVATSNVQAQSRPIILNRPFKSVAELGYAFSGTPWKNLDFFTPESGDSALLDLFTLNDTNDLNGLEAGKINLNTQQVPVLKAIINGAYKDEQTNYTTQPTWAVASLTGTSTGGEVYNIATKLTNRTLSTNPLATISGGQGPLRNVGELVGRFVTVTNIADPNISGNVYVDGGKSFAGFAGDLINSSNPNDLTTALSGDTTTSSIQRMRESAIRALAAAGQTRVWNVMIDVVAQTGNYPPTATSFDQFTVQGEQRYWIHLAIDRLTGQVIDKQVEIVKE